MAVADGGPELEALRGLLRENERALAALRALATTKPVLTFRQVYDACWPTRAASLEFPEAEGVWLTHYLLPSLGEHTSSTLKPMHIRGLIASLRGRLAPMTLNKIRGAGRRLLDVAIENDLWGGHPNPFDAVKPARVPQRRFKTLDFGECALLLASLPDIWRPMFELEVRLGPRAGEIYALEKSDVDTRRWTVSFCRSHGRPTTKTGRVREHIPVPDDLRVWLQKALDASPGNLVFPDPRGHRFRRDYKMNEMVLRPALVRAGLLEGYRYVCGKVSRDKRRRGRGCGMQEVLPVASSSERWCPVCARRMCCVPVPRPVTFKDLRHTAATLMAASGVPESIISEVLGHAHRSTTARFYLQHSEETVRAALNKVRVPVAVPHAEGSHTCKRK